MIRVKLGQEVIRSLKQLGSEKKAASSSWFFKTAKGQYGYGDKFIGVTVPEQRKVAKQYRSLPLKEVSRLLKSKIHEYRLTGLFILVDNFNHADLKQQGEIVRFYMDHLDHVNNWDLVDSSASYILGQYLCKGAANRKIIYRLAKSKNLWHRRVAIISTHAFIRVGQFDDTLKLAALFMTDRHDLMHKAVGWMLREVGKKSRNSLVQFLDIYAAKMPRTMLRYSIEHFDKEERMRYMYKI